MSASQSEAPPHTQQLPLPLDDFMSRAPGPGIPRPARVFCNRNLKLSGISWIGFDMDYTLAIYDQPAMDDLSIRATIEKLIRRGYPDFIKTVPVSTQFPVRGLLIDKRFGHVLKMDRYKHVHKGYHGFRELTKEELRMLYHSKKIRPATPRYHWIDTLYALSEVATYAALVDAMEKKGYAVDYAKLFTDIRECIDEAHRDGTILDEVMNNLPHFVHRDANLAPALHKLRSAGKKLFLLTNSRAAYTEKMMTYLLGGAMSEYPHWKNFFDVVIVAATKPVFFTERRPLLERDGEMTRPAVPPLERGKIYEGGNLLDVERALGATGDEVLYVGDHIYGDIIRNRKVSLWRTCFVVQELEREIDYIEQHAGDIERLHELDSVRARLDDLINHHKLHLNTLDRLREKEREKGTPTTDLEGRRTKGKADLESLRRLHKSALSEAMALEDSVERGMNRYWGLCFKEGNENSRFGEQVEDYADLYTSRVSNFLHYSPMQFFRSTRDTLPHERVTARKL